MFAVLKHVYQYFTEGSSNELEDEDEDEISIHVSNLIENVDRKDEARPEVQSAEPSLKSQLMTVHLNGTITKLLTDSGVIDNKYQFDLTDCLGLPLKVGDRVSYFAYRHNEDEEWRVKRILTVLDENWDDEEGGNSSELERNNVDNEPETINTKPANTVAFVGVVVERKGRIVVVRDRPQNLDKDSTTSRDTSFSLDKISSSFYPEEGDYVRVEAVVELDTDKVNLCGDVVEVLSVAPQRSRTDEGEVTLWIKRDKWGMISHNVYFNSDACTTGYFPKQGDRVKMGIIESTRKGGWRATSVEPCNFVHDIFEVENKKQVIPFRLDPERVKNKGNITVSEPSKVSGISTHEKVIIHISVTNSGKNNQTICNIVFNNIPYDCEINFEEPFRPNSILGPGRSATYGFVCCSHSYGLIEQVVTFHFSNFQIDRLISWEVSSLELDKMLAKGTPLHRYDKKSHTRSLAESAAAQREHEINQPRLVRGERISASPNFVAAKMLPFHVPNYFEEIYYNHIVGSDPPSLRKALKENFPFLFGDLTPDTYKEKFHHLLYIHEIDTKIALTRYNMSRVSFNRAGPAGEFLSLFVENLAEKRPSLLAGDTIRVFESSRRQNASHFEGVIHRVLKNELWLKFNQSFHTDYHGQDYDVCFNLSRGTFKKCHNAIELCLSRQALMWLFPQCVSSKPAQITFQEVESYSLEFGVEHSVMNGSCSFSQSESSSEISTNVPNGITSPKESKLVNMLKNHSKTRNSGNLCNVTTESPKNKEDLNLNGIPDSGASLLNNGVNPHKLEDKLRNAVEPKDLNWVNPRLNARQQDAVRNILRGEGRPLPFVIFGPPGTGKTMTLVEAILQTFLMMPDSRILVATPSNSSADLIAERLIDSGKLQTGDMVRLVAHHLVVEGKVPPRLVPFSSTVDINANAPNEPQATAYGVSHCSGQVLGRHRITVGTCVTTGQLHYLRLAPGHFSHVFIDEAGQAMEPEILIPLGFISVSSGQSILAGDPLQLGPVVPSRLAASLGLDKALLARLLVRFPYKRDHIGFPETGGYDPRLVTRLNVNYRSLPDILELPSTMFYDSDLEAKIQDVDSLEANFLERFTTSVGLPNYAVIFHGVTGSNELEEDSPSWFNRHEVYQVATYIKSLADYNVDPEDIGIITPYQKQVQKLRCTLERLELPVPKIGSVEEFQGQERLVIILSTVRSTMGLVSTDVKHALGFVSCKERLNVAISRARALLIIVGNPYVLRSDCYWRNVLEYCIEKNSYKGCSLSPEIVNS